MKRRLVWALAYSPLIIIAAVAAWWFWRDWKPWTLAEAAVVAALVGAWLIFAWAHDRRAKA